MEANVLVVQPHSHSAVRPGSWFPWVFPALGAIALGVLLVMHFGAHAVGETVHEHLHTPHWWSILPFVCILLCIAILPLLPATAHWWESNTHRLGVSLVCAALTLGYFLWDYGVAEMRHRLEHAVLEEYIPFIVLLLSLYVISGGINLSGDLRPLPLTNTCFIGMGTLLASFIGTTGASMLLIRPLLQINRSRRHVAHTVIFFIFLVSNVGGCLLPIGDPPLFLGYLRGVPFTWTFRLWLEWGCASSILLLIYLIWDRRLFRSEGMPEMVPDVGGGKPALDLRGGLNFLWLIGVVLAVGFIQTGKPVPLLGVKAFPFMREVVMLGFMGLSLLLTDRTVRQANQFNYHAILEVAALFIGIFICMQAPILILDEMGGRISAKLTAPWMYFWATGTLSAFLDNAPTYVVFFETAVSSAGGGAQHLLDLGSGRMISESSLAAISLGAVFMGAMTYIGNGPNFMVKSIAEQNGVRMPTFFGYMLYSTLFLAPVFILVSIVFLR